MNESVAYLIRSLLEKIVIRFFYLSTILVYIQVHWTKGEFVNQQNRGVIKWVIADFGVIQPDSGSEDIYTDFRHVKTHQTKDQKILRGRRVSYDIEQKHDTDIAVNVCFIGEKLLDYRESTSRQYLLDSESELLPVLPG